MPVEARPECGDGRARELFMTGERHPPDPRLTAARRIFPSSRRAPRVRLSLRGATWEKSATALCPRCEHGQCMIGSAPRYKLYEPTLASQLSINSNIFSVTMPLSFARFPLSYVTKTQRPSFVDPCGWEWYFGVREVQQTYRAK